MTQLIHTASGATFQSEEQARKHYSGVSAAANNGFGITLDPADSELLAKLKAVGYAEHTPEPPYVPTLDELKTQAKQRITQNFYNTQATGKVLLSLGWEIDVRRDAQHNDVQNMDSLYDLVVASGQTTAQIKGADNILHIVTLAEFILIKMEMKQYGLGLYSHKWEKESAIDAALTAAEIDAVQW